MQPPGKIAAMTSIRLQGKHKPIYHALSEFELLHNIPHVVNDIYIIMLTIKLALNKGMIL